jgi:DNA-binding CsgD family transcriptional regulator
LHHAFAVLALEAASRSEFRARVLEALAPAVSFESAIYYTRGEREMSTINKDPRLLARFVANQRAYIDELRPIQVAATSQGGVAIDTDVFGPSERACRAVYREILEPQSMRSMMHVFVQVPGRAPRVLVLGRHDRLTRDFRERDVRTAQSLIPLLSVAEALWEARPTKAVSREDLWHTLTAREREIATHAAAGLRNQEIGDACGTSVNTVRKQLVAIFRKLGVTTRTELARIAMHALGS